MTYEQLQGSFASLRMTDSEFFHAFSRRGLNDSARYAGFPPTKSLPSRLLPLGGGESIS